jgi:NDP-sugar pyrophosphorylase family protein
MQAVVLAGGKGRRLAPYTRILPKPLVPIGDMPIIEVLIRQLKWSGIDDITLAVGYLGNLLRAYFGDGSQLGVQIRYAHEDQPLGTVGPLACIPRPQEAFLTLNGDILTTLRICDLVACHRRSGALATIAMRRRIDKVDLGVVVCDEHSKVVDYVEKPTRCYTVSMGVYVFEPRVLDHIVPGEYLDFPDLVRRLLDAGELVVAYPFEGYWQDLGRLDDYEQAAQDFEAMRSQFLREECDHALAATAC